MEVVNPRTGRKEFVPRAKDSMPPERSRPTDPKEILERSDS